jgi:hypothetical protein
MKKVKEQRGWTERATLARIKKLDATNKTSIMTRLPCCDDLLASQTVKIILVPVTGVVGLPPDEISPRAEL